MKPKVKKPQAKFFNKFKAKTYLKLICFTMSSICFVYQSSQFVSIYFSGKTVVENRIERLKYSQIPAITVCLPTFFDVDKFSEYLKGSNKQGHRQLYKKYLDYNKTTLNEWNNETELILSSLWDKYHNLYKKEHKVFRLIDLFNNASTSMTVGFRWTSYAFNETDHIFKLKTPRPIHSIVMDYISVNCFTIFSDFDREYRKRKVSLARLVVKLTHSNRSFPLNRLYNENFYISLHSQNNLPDYKLENVFRKLEMGRCNFITYSERQTKRLPPPYQTNCKIELFTR